MRSHRDIEKRSLAMAKAIVAKIDRDPDKKGLDYARETCRRWYRDNSSPSIEEWLTLLDQPWSEIRLTLLSDSEKSRRLRQSDPFCGILTPQERWEIYRDHDTRAA